MDCTTEIWINVRESHEIYRSKEADVQIGSANQRRGRPIGRNPQNTLVWPITGHGNVDIHQSERRAVARIEMYVHTGQLIVLDFGIPD